MSRYIHIVLDTQLGWDSAVAAFTKESDAEAYAESRGDTNVVSSVELYDAYDPEDH